MTPRHSQYRQFRKGGSDFSFKRMMISLSNGIYITLNAAIRGQEFTRKHKGAELFAEYIIRLSTVTYKGCKQVVLIIFTSI